MVTYLHWNAQGISFDMDRLLKNFVLHFFYQNALKQGRLSLLQLWNPSLIIWRILNMCAVIVATLDVEVPGKKSLPVHHHQLQLLVPDLVPGYVVLEYLLPLWAHSLPHIFSFSSLWSVRQQHKPHKRVRQITGVFWGNKLNNCQNPTNSTQLKATLKQLALELDIYVYVVAKWPTPPTHYHKLFRHF